MSEEEIKKLCNEYADDTVESYGFSSETVEELKEDQESKALSVIRFLLRDHCIVPKEQIRTMQKDLKEAVKEIREDAFPVCEFEEKLIFAEDAISYFESLLDSDLFDQKGE